MKYRYGPLVWNCTTDEDESGNYFWPGLPPVGYDEIGIPIDDRGYQCLPNVSIINPGYVPTETTFHDLINDSLPTIRSASTWFDENFLITTPRQVGRFIIRWYDLNHKYNTRWESIVNTYQTRERLVDAIWPELQK